MKTSEIKRLADALDEPAQSEEPVLIETHISWIILAGGFAYKIKKPVLFSFLDFTSSEKRKYYCERELVLNRRLAAQMYLRVIPVCQNGVDFSVNQKNGQIVDYALQMVRMDSAKEMNKMLLAGQVREETIFSLAAKLAAFHRAATVISQPLDISALGERFNDLLSARTFAGQHLGSSFSTLITGAIQYSNRFLDKYRSAILERSVKGFVRDLHGDLHTANIFLYDDPVIFDCIEFNDAMRELDILDELAFLGMDIEAYGRKDLSDLLYNEYHRMLGIDQNQGTIALYVYYKCYRANVRAKVLLLRAAETKDRQVFAASIHSARGYLQLLANYMEA
ncbi:hypothetical protein PQ469_07780 [Mucilaginibacter sp. KACC 22773]|uniref:hypothetical protein n=1 Tax=Mucilaginibacter sp. KACC 22773 TaxID=3025671 RepID=UPI002365171E|nr:hypothetical protein [Mucilaginibacter sp. KACC 22773]WDF79904.1 hypothetical protein PQ469_07780 [Mucilaginibacter sp. KACC 22773]